MFSSMNNIGRTSYSVFTMQLNSPVMHGVYCTGHTAKKMTRPSSSLITNYVEC